MKLIAAGTTSALLLTGVAGSVAAYRSQVADVERVDRPVAVQPTPRPPGQPSSGPVRWAPCKQGRLENGVCVTDVVRTVVLSPSTVARAGEGDHGDDDQWAQPSDDEGTDDHGDGDVQWAQASDDDDDHDDDDHAEDDD